MNTQAQRTMLQMIVNAISVLSYLGAFGFFVFTMVYGLINQSVEYVPALAVMMLIMKAAAAMNKWLDKQTEKKVTIKA